MQKPVTAAPVPPDRQLERISDIEYWWSGIHGAAADSSRRPSEPRLFAAFRRVLLAMPDDDFERFMELSPTVIFQPAVEGTVYSYWLPIIPGADHVVLRVIYICPDLRKWSDERIVRLVAHEAAHLVLGHADAGSYGPGKGEIHAEEETDRKAESWGFKGAHSGAHRKRLATQHERDKRGRT
jgi:hypothetical protein